MGAVQLTKNDKKAYSVFSWLRKKLPYVDIGVLRHISVYIARTNEEFDVNKDLQLSFFVDGLMCKLLLTNETEIRFANYPDGLNFVVEKNDADICMTIVVSTHEKDNLSTAFVHGDVCVGDWGYLVGFDETEKTVESDNNGFIKIYHKGELIDNGTSYFNVTTENDIGLDCIDGLGQLTTVMTRVELIYNYFKGIDKNKLVRKK